MLSHFKIFVYIYMQKLTVMRQVFPVKNQKKKKKTSVDGVSTISNFNVFSHYGNT